MPLFSLFSLQPSYMRLLYLLQIQGLLFLMIFTSFTKVYAYAYLFLFFLVESLALNGLYISPALYIYILKYNLSILDNAAYIYVFKVDCHWIDCSWCALLWGRLLKCPKWRMIYYLDWDFSKDISCWRPCWCLWSVLPLGTILWSVFHASPGGSVDIHGLCCHRTQCGSPWSVLPLPVTGKETSFLVV